MSAPTTVTGDKPVDNRPPSKPKTARAATS